MIKEIISRLRLPYNIIKCRLFDIYKPLVVLFYVTDRCNLQCRYCVGHWSNRKIQDFTTEEIFKIVDECKELGTVHFTIHGGEIFLRKDVKEIVEYMKRKGLYVNVVTNGILLPSRAEDIKGIDSLCISLDGREENHDYNRGKGSYRAAMNAIRFSKERGFRFVVQATLTKRNVGDIEYLCQQAKEIGYYQQFSLLLKPLNQNQKDELGLDDEDARQALRKIIGLKRAGFPVFASYRTLKNALYWPFSFEKSRLTKEEYAPHGDLIRCFYGKLKIAIDANGFVFPCSSLNDSFKALNVKEVGVKKAYEHVLKENDCEACYYLTQNDWSLLLGANPAQFLDQVRLQLYGLLNIYR